MAKWREVEMISRDEHIRLLSEISDKDNLIKKLSSENEELRNFLKKFREKTTSMFQ